MKRLIKNNELKKNRITKNKILKSAHLIMYNREFYEINYLDIKCPICNSRIDKLGYCACDAHL
jgi:hypothetical protein